MEELKEKYQKMEGELKEKWHNVIIKIAEKNGVDMGVAWDMLRATALGGNYTEGIEFDEKELLLDLAKLGEVGGDLAKAEGIA